MPYDLSLDEALVHLEEVETELTPTKELQGIDPDLAFVLGYQTAIYELRKVTGPTPVMETGIITFYPKEIN